MPGGPSTITAWHGTTRAFSAFDATKSRSVLNDGYWAPGGQASRSCFLTSSREAAEAYATAARNAEIPREDAIPAMERTLAELPWASALFRDLIDRGSDAAWCAYMAASPDGTMASHPEAEATARAGVDLNDIMDLAAVVENSRSGRAAGRDAEASPERLLALFGSGGLGPADHAIDTALRLGVDWRPRVLEIEIPIAHFRDAPTREVAEVLIAEGIPAVRIPPDHDTVRWSDEIVLADPAAAVIVRSHILPREVENLWEMSHWHPRHQIYSGDDAQRLVAGEAPLGGADTTPTEDLDQAVPGHRFLLAGISDSGHLACLAWMTPQADGTYVVVPEPVLYRGVVAEARTEAAMSLVR